jgi:thymidylate synthase (FAD)
MTWKRPSVSVLSYPKDPDAVALCAAAARLCYRPASIRMLREEKIPREEQERLFLKVVRSGHLSCLRHANFVFGLEGVSRSFSHQLVRHTVGHAYEQQSQHFITERAGEPLSRCDLDEVPKEEPRRSAIYKLFDEAVDFSKRVYTTMVEYGLPNHQARQVLPNATETRLVWTANLNALLWFVQVRACRVNTPEIREVAGQVRVILKDHVPILEPFLGPTCYTRGVCYEGSQRFLEECRAPWSTCVLWDEDFPRRVRYVSVKGWWENVGLGCGVTGSSADPRPWEEMK